VLKGIPQNAKHVLDVGAGTGNVSKNLLNRGHRVTAIENNQSMVDKILSKKLDATGKFALSKDSAEGLETLKNETFDAAVAVNVLYALDDPLGCIRNVARVLKPGGAFAFSTTHTETELAPLLASIKNSLIAEGKWDLYEEHYQRVYEINMDIDATIARRYSIQDYQDWLQEKGFEITYTNPSSYEGAVVVFYARKL